ncbi:MAG: RelA/SpoT family protein [Acidimicrobiales bacterium]
MATVTRVLPWRRDAQAAATTELDPLLEGFRGRHARGQVQLVTRAYEMAVAAHAGQLRRSGEPYIVHPLAVATIVARQSEDAETIAAALLHDAVEDTAITIAEIEGEFGADVAAIVDGVTKLERVNFPSKEAQHAATIRKLFVAMSKDLRVLIIKLSDRMHNMRTIGALPLDKQRRIAQETFDIYAPLAHRLGMQDMKQQLEDLAFAALHPKWYAEIDHLVTSRTPERELYLTQVEAEVQRRLHELRINADVTGRPKHLWSIYEKMVVKGRDFDDIFDLVGIRVLVDSVNDCYAALGSIHAIWKPVQGRFKDFIAMPKFNNYRSLHTTVIGPGAKSIEVQIRTREMNLTAEFGVAAHWRYKAKGGDLEWLNRIVDWQADTADPSQFMAELKTDLDQDEIVVFTPKGELVSLPTGATPIDFAYSIHTEVGHRCIGARVDGALVSLDQQLKTGDTVQIFTSKAKGAGPSKDWLDVAVSPKARNKIKQWFSREQRLDSIETGRETLEKAIRVKGMSPPAAMGSSGLAEVVAELNYADQDSLFQAIGEGHVSPKAVAARVARALRHGDPAEVEQLPTSVQAPRRPSRARPSVGVHIDGFDDVLVRLARCCTPVPGDEIIGFHTRGRGVAVHRADCANAVSLSSANKDRLVDVEWDVDHGGRFVASIEVRAFDRTGLLRDVTTVLAEHHINILSCATTTHPDRVSKMRFEFDLGDPSHLASLVNALRGVKGVYLTRRVLPGA